jgi:class I fructose-bisphosphate aldolase
MSMTEANIKQIMSYYESDNPGTKTNILRILMQGKLAGTGKMIILPVDQGFEHGPGRSFYKNPLAYDPHYHFKLAIAAGLNAYAAPLGMLEAGAATFAGQIPLILKINSGNTLYNGEANQAITGSVKDALRLGCVAVGFTIYPGTNYTYEMMEEIRAIAEEAKSVGLAVVIWSYPRGGAISKDGEQALDVIAYAAHMAALLGAHIIKVKLPVERIELEAAKKPYETIAYQSLSQRVAHVVESCFNGKRLVIFSGGPSKDDEGLIDDVRAIKEGGGNGSIIGRNTFQRSWDDALSLLAKMIEAYK